jgi:hypothetical protein
MKRIYFALVILMPFLLNSNAFSQRWYLFEGKSVVVDVNNEFKAGPIETGLNIFRGFSFDRPVKLPSYTLSELNSGTGYYNTMGVGTMVFCSDCARQTSPCSQASSNGGTIAVLNIQSGSPVWQCQ